MCIVAYYNYWHCSVSCFFSSFYVCLYVCSVSVLFIMGKPKIISIFRNYKFFILYRTYCKLQATGWVATIFVVCFTSMYSVCVFWAYSLGYEAKLVRKN